MITSHKHPLPFLRLGVLAAFVLGLVLSVMPGPQTGLLLAAPAPVGQAVGAAATDAACTTLQPDETIGKDAWIKQDNITENNDNSELRVGTELNKLNRSLIAFDLTSAVPTNAKVTSATLSLWAKDVSGNATISAHQLVDYWTEDAVTWRYQDKVSTEEWTNLGADYNAAVLDSESFTNGVKDYWATFNVSSAAQAWAANPAANYGVILESPGNAAKALIKFESSDDNSTPSKRPKLQVCWSVGVGVSPDRLAQGTAGQNNIYAHTVTVTDFTSEPVGLTAVSNQGWTVNIYKDVNGDGVKDAADTAITQTPAMGPNGSYKILVEVVVPANAPNGTKDITTVTATGLSQGTVDTAKDTTLVGFPPVADPVLDGRRDLAYTQSLDSNTQDYCDASGNVLARLMSLYDAASPDYVWVILEMELAHADTTYGTGSHPSWGGSRSLGSMDGSDKGQMILRDANGTVIFDVTSDFLEDSRPTPSGWGSAGVTGGEGSVAVGNASQVAVESSIGYNLNRFCTSSASCTVSGVNLFVNSPPVNADYTPVNSFFADWQYPYLYEFRFDRSAFGSAGFGSATINNVHISPNKTGSNEIPVTPCAGSIGDRVWQDYDGDKIQDNNEPGLNGVMVNLYRDTGNGTFEPGTDLAINTRFTAGDGDYDFTGLGPGTYFVDVVNSTVPSDYVLTTANEPLKVVLAKGQDYNDADFGYRTVPNIAISKTLISGDPALVGSTIEFSIRITNTGNVPIDILPVVDYYDPTYLQFASATPAQSSVSGGVVRWNDLLPGPTNLLAVNASTSVTVRFTALKSTAATVIRAGRSADATDAEPVVDGLLELNYTFVGRSDPAGNAPGNLYKYTGASMCYYAFVVDRSYNDNVYADDDDPYLLLDGWDGHTYGNLDGSDKAIFTVSGPNGTYEDMEMDYITEDNGAFLVDFYDPPINAAKTSLWHNLNHSGWNGNGPSPQYVNGDPTYHSPPYNWNDTLGQYWEWHMIYEFSIPKSNVGTDCGTVTLAGAHNSPSKDDDSLGLIGDYIWADVDAQGDQDPNEVGIPNVRVNLYKNNVLVRTTETEPGTSGFYIFSNLEAGTYVVNVDESTLPVGYVLTTNNEPKTVNLSAGQDYRTADFGYVPGQGTIGDRVYYDINGDGGVDNDGEPGINNVTVNLYQGSCPGSGQPFKTQVTSGNGDYLFTTLPGGSYCVNVDESTLPANYTLTTANEPMPVALAQDQHYLLADFGYRIQQTGKSCDVATVFGAKDQYGTSPGDKSDFACVAIIALDFGDLPDTTSGTGAGNYQTLLANNGPRHTITGLKMGATVDGEPDGQPNATATGDGADEDGVTIPTLIVGQTATVVVNSSGTAKLNAFFDWNNDGDFNDSGETITQLSVVAGNNNLSVPVPAGAVTGVNLGARFRLSTAGSLTSLGAAADGEVEDYLVQVQAPGITIEKTTNGASADFADGPDVQQIVPGATVTWQYLVTNNGTLDIARGGIQVSDNVVGNLMVNGVVQTLSAPYTGVTLVSGTSLSDNILQAGESFTLQVTRAAETLSAIDPNASGSDPYVVGCKNALTNPNGRTTYKNTATATVPGATASDDSHYCNPPNSGAIGDFVWYDSNKDGVQDVGEPGIPNVTLDLYKDTDGTPGLNTATDTKVGSTVTDADGGYLFTGLEPGTYFVDVTDIGGKLAGLSHIVANQSKSDPTPAIVLPSGGVYKDADFGYVDNSSGKAFVGDTVWYDYNSDGIQQPGEPGIPNVTVNIRNSSGTIIGTDDTDANGHYLVKVDPGNGYTAAPDPADIPVGFTATTPVLHPLPLLSAGDHYLDADFGYDSSNLGTIGNLVFEDKNNNGIFNSGTEAGLPGISVDLIRDANGNKAWDIGEPVIATVTTDKNGGYLFTGLPADNYLVHVSDTNGVLLNYNKSILGTAGADNNNQTDPYAITLPTGGNNLTADFGYVKIDPSLGQIGNQVWVESDGNGLFNPTGSDIGQAGVTVALYRNGSPYATTTTGASGDYLFTKLPSGTYTVTVSDSFNVLSDWIITTLGPNQGSDDNNQLQPYQIVLAAGGENLTADFGYTRPSAIGDLVWYDADKDGIQDVGEPGIPNVTLNLYRDKDGSGTINAGDPLIGTKVTDADGGYLFPGLVAGDYIVDVTDTNNKLAGLTQIVANQAKPDPTAKIVLGAGVKYEDADFGYVKNPTGGKAIIGDTVWYDDNGDGVQQPNEPGIPNIQVCATPVGGGAAVCATTNDNGVYLVEVNPGTYNVAPTNPPGGYTATTPVPHGPVTVDAGEQYLDADFGYNDNGSLLGKAGNLVFVEDKASRDGIYNGSDKPLGGVSISLIRDTNGNKVWDAGEPIIATTTSAAATDAIYGSNGNYLFTGLVAGNYLVHVSDTNAVLLDYNRTILGPSQGSDNNNQKDPYGFSMTVGSQNLTADFGYYRTDRPNVGVIGNQVWIEKDGNGLYDVNSGDVGQPGVTVQLLNNGVLVRTTTTGPSGDYSFVGLPAGNYTTRVTDSLNVLAGYRITQLGPIQGSDNNNQLQPYTVILPKNGVNLTADFGYILPAAIGDFVYYDTDKDGIQDVGEPGIPNVALDLYRDTNNNGVLNIGTDEKIASTVTDRDGGYLFPNLIPGKYIVDVTAASNPNGNLGILVHSLGNQSATDPTPAITLVGGTVYKDADFGYYEPTGPGKALIGDTVWYDANGDGVQQPEEPGIPDITVRATDPDGVTYDGVTDETGTYHIQVPQGTYTVQPVNPPAGLTVTTDPTWGPYVMLAGTQRLDADFGYTGSGVFGTIGNLVFWDKDRDGIYNNSDVALGGVSVALIRDSNGNKAWDTGEPIIATATTKTALDGSTGNYLFTGLVAGNYLVHVSDTNAVLFDFEKSVLGSNQTANNHNKADPYAITLGVAQNNLTADFGYYRRPNQPKVGVIGNQIWIETDLNGLFDVVSKDRGQAGVTVDLYEAGVRLATTTSGASGDYSFVHLPSGTYTVAVSDNQAVLTGLSLTTLGPNQGSDNNNQQQPYTVGLAEGGINLTADFGYKDSASNPGAVQIGNSVWSDVNNNGLLDSGEKAIGDVVVKLWLDLDNNCTLNTTSDVYVGKRTTGSSLGSGNTNYLFDYPKGLPSGNYLVQVTDPNFALVGATKSTAQVPGADNNSQAMPYCIQNFNPAGTGAVNLTADFGYLLPPASFSLTKTTITPGPVRPGTTISFSIRITNTGSTWLTKLPLADTYDKEYIGYLSANPASVDNSNDGTINWTDLLSGVGPLAPGGSVQIIANFVSIRDTGDLPGSVTVNVATVSGATSDPDGPGPAPTNLTPLPDKSAQDVIAIINPTAVLVTNSQVVGSENGAQLSWQTVSEVNVAGYNLLRINPDSSITLLTSPSIPAQKPGQSEGASYSWVDSSVVAGQFYTYILEVIGLDGFTQQVMIGQLGGIHLFLPLTSR